MKEKRQFFDLNCKPTGKYYYPGDVVPEGCLPIVVMIAIENSRGDFLMQKRSRFKTSPLTWTVTGGHPCFDETNVQGMIREVKEELGLDIQNEKIESFFLGCDTVCREMFYCKKDLDIDKLVIQPEEVEAVAWFSREKILQMMENGELSRNQTFFYQKFFEWQNKK